MSCVFSLALPDCCYVVADTRINLAAVNGDSGTNDDRPQDFAYPDGTEEKIGAAYRKIRRTNFGWAAGAGAFLLVYPLLRRMEALNKPEDVPQAIATVHEEQLNRLTSAAPQLAATLNQTAVLYTFFRGSRFQLQAYDLRTHTGLPKGSQYVLIDPPGFPPNINSILQGRIKTELAAKSTEAAIRQNVRILANIFHTVHENSSTVSDIIEIGITQSDRRGLTSRHLLTQNATITAATDSELAKLLHT